MSFIDWSSAKSSWLLVTRGSTCRFRATERLSFPFPKWNQGCPLYLPNFAEKNLVFSVVFYSEYRPVLAVAQDFWHSSAHAGRSTALWLRLIQPMYTGCRFVHWCTCSWFIVFDMVLKLFGVTKFLRMEFLVLQIICQGPWWIGGQASEALLPGSITGEKKPQSTTELDRCQFQIKVSWHGTIMGRVSGETPRRCHGNHHIWELLFFLGTLFQHEWPRGFDADKRPWFLAGKAHGNFQNVFFFYFYFFF